MDAMILANEAMEYATNIIQASEKDIMQGCSETSANTCAKQKITYLRSKTRGLTPLQSVTHIKEAKAGNCEEYAILVMDYFNHLKLMNTNVEVLRIEHKNYEVGELVDHVIIVVNRDKSSKLSDPKSWGKDAVVLDPLFNKIIQANQIENNLQVPLIWYTNQHQGHICQSFDSNRFQFALHYNLEQFKNNQKALPIPFPYKSLIKWGCDEIDNLSQSKTLLLFGAKRKFKAKENNKILSEQPFIRSLL